jgi:hypothetical protein
VDTPKAQCRNAIVGANIQEQAAVAVSQMPETEIALVMR